MHQAHHLTFKEGGKTRTVYVPQDLLAEVRSWVQEHQRLKALIHEVSQLTRGPDPGPRLAPAAAAGATLNIGPILAQTVGHFFPDLNTWIDQIDDPRFLPLVVYHKRFLRVVGAELVPLQVEQPASTRLPVEHRRPGGAAQPQSPGGHGDRTAGR